MNTQVKLDLLRWRLLNFADRVLNKLQIFPLTLLFVVFSAVGRAIQLRLGHGLVRVGSVATVSASLPRNVMLWLGRALSSRQGQYFDVCLRLPRNAAGHGLHDVVSVLLAFPGSRSIYLYWDSSSLADDLPLLQSKQNPSAPAILLAPHEDLDSVGIRQLELSLRAGHAEIALPVASTRDAQTLLKRRARARRAVCLNVPIELWGAMDAIAQSLPNTYFFRFTAQPPPNDTLNIETFFDCGFTLHERMALIRASDAYVGEFDELGCTALISGRTSFLLGGGDGAQCDRFDGSEIAVWFPSSMEPERLSDAVLQFLSHYSVSGGK